MSVCVCTCMCGVYTAHMHINQRQLPYLRYDSSGFVPQKVRLAVKFEFRTTDVEFGFRDLHKMRINVITKVCACSAYWGHHILHPYLDVGHPDGQNDELLVLFNVKGRSQHGFKQMRPAMRKRLIIRNNRHVHVASWP